MRVVVRCTKLIFFLSLLLMSACTIEKRLYMKGYLITSHISFKKKGKAKQKILIDKNETVILKENTRPSFISSSGEKSCAAILNIESDSFFVGSEHIVGETPPEREKIIKSKEKIMVIAQNQEMNEVKETHTHNDSKIDHKLKRKTAILTGGALILMAVLAGFSIPNLGTLTASIGLIGIFLLDILVSIGVLKYHKKQKPKLAKTSSILRLIYTAILGVAVGYHIAGSVTMFNHLWGIGLIAFGIHLISLGILYNNEGGKKWVNYLIKSLLIIAGMGYVILHIGALIVPNPLAFTALIQSFFIIPMVLGEMFYALWMLIRGGKSTAE